MRYFVDTNVFLRVLIREDERMLRDGAALFSAIRGGTLAGYTSGLVLSEINWTLASFYGFGRSEVLRALRGIVATANLRVVDAVDAPVALDLFERHRVKWVDCLIASAPDIQSGATAVVSYDRDFDRLGVPRLEPAAALDDRG